MKIRYVLIGTYEAELIEFLLSDMSPLAILLSAGWLTGIIVATATQQQLWLLTVLPIIVFLAWRWRIKLPVIVAALLLVGLGYVYGDSLQRSERAAECEPTAGIGTIVRQPVLEASRVQYVVRLDATCTVLVYGPRWPVWAMGDRITIAGGTFSSTSDVMHELPGYGAYLARRGIGATWRYPDIKLLQQRGLYTSFIYTRLRSAIHQIFIEPDAAVVRAMLLADRGGIPDHISEQFRIAGVTHVLAISGAHISLFAALLLVVFSLLPLPRWWRTSLLLLVMWFYIVLVGAPASAVRAGIFWSVALVWLELGFLGGWPTAVVLATLVMVTVDPAIVFDVGWQLSLSAVIGLLMALFLIPQRVWSWSVVGLSTLLMTVGATLATAPIIMYHFGQLSVWSVLANVLIVPVSSVLLAGALLAVLLGFVWLPLGILLGGGVHIVLVWMYAVAALITRLPLASTAVPQFSARWILLYYLGLGALCYLVIRRQGRSWREVWA